jgi:hypothetical protein
LGLWTVLLLSVIFWAPATYPGYWQSAEGFVPALNAAYTGPVATVAAQADLWRGSGSATFLLTSPLINLGVEPLWALSLAFALCVILGGLGCYIWLAPRLGDRAAGLAGLIYMAAPAMTGVLYRQGSLSMATVLALLPLILAGLTAYRYQRSPAAIGAAVLGLLWLWHAQAGMAVLATLVLLLYALLVEKDRLALLALAVSAAASLLSLSRVMDLQAAPLQPFAQGFLSLAQLLTLSPAPSAQATPPPVTLGPVMLIFGLLALWLLWRNRRGQPTLPTQQRGERQRLLLFSLVTGLVGAGLSLAWSAPLWSLSGGERLLTYPWQALLITAPFAAALAGSLPALSPDLSRTPLWASLLGIALLGAMPHLLPDFTGYRPPAQPVAVYGEPVKILLLEAEVTTGVTAEGDHQAALTVAWQPLQGLDFDYNIFFQALQPNGEGGYDVIAQLDQQPLFEQPATTWGPGQLFTATYTLALPADPNQDVTRYYFGYYNWQDGSRLPRQGGMDDKVILYGDR